MPSKVSKNLHCFIVYSKETEALAMEQAAHMRGRNINVDYSLAESSTVKQMRAAAQSGAKFAAIFELDGSGNARVRLKDMATGGENITDGTAENIIGAICQ
jgi:histidyl-tRNA synthetase